MYIKCVLVGDSKSGKKWLLNSFVTNDGNPDEYDSGINFITTKIPLGGKYHDVTIIIANGSKDYDRLRPLLYPETDIFLLCFSVDAPSSFNKIKGQWVQEIRHHCKKTPFLLVGTKVDLRDDVDTMERLQQSGQQVISAEMGQILAEECQAVQYMECSALTREGVKEVFDQAVLATKTAEKKDKCVIV